MKGKPATLHRHPPGEGSPRIQESSTAASDQCALPASVLNAHGLIHLRESGTADLHLLGQRLRTGEYSKPFVIDDGVTRSLHFSPAFVQSEMRLDQPHALSLAYARKMMGFLLFQPRPRDVVIVGLGGGSLTKFCRGALPHARITTVEIDADVIGFGWFFDIPAPDDKTRIVHADAVEYFATTEQRADVVLLDGCDANGTATAFGNRDFYCNLRGRLRSGGVLVANLVGPSERIAAHRQLIRETFADRVIEHHVASEGNHVAFAFNEPGWTPDWPALTRQAGKLTRRVGLDFPGLVRKLQRSHERRTVPESHSSVRFFDPLDK